MCEYPVTIQSSCGNVVYLCKGGRVFSDKTIAEKCQHAMDAGYSESDLEKEFPRQGVDIPKNNPKNNGSTTVYTYPRYNHRRNYCNRQTI